MMHDALCFVLCVKVLRLPKSVKKADALPLFPGLFGRINHEAEMRRETEHEYTARNKKGNRHPFWFPLGIYSGGGGFRCGHGQRLGLPG